MRKLQAILKPMMLRRLKDDVEKNLAPKEETIIEVGAATDSRLVFHSFSPTVPLFNGFSCEDELFIYYSLKRKSFFLLSFFILFYLY